MADNRDDTSGGKPKTPLPRHLFVTCDAESEHIPGGVPIFSAIRDEVEKQCETRIPVVWFVRYQRSWVDSVERDSLSHFQSPVTGGFDGFELMPELDELVARGDEIAWHYHAYHYVSRDDLHHEAKVANISADLVACAQQFRAVYPQLDISSFRWGWFFTPDYRLNQTLRTLGIRSDASQLLSSGGKAVEVFKSTYLEPLTNEPREVDGIHYFPHRDTVLVHDWNLVPHDYDWSALDEAGAQEQQVAFRNLLTEFVGDGLRRGVSCATYRDVISGLSGNP